MIKHTKRINSTLGYFHVLIGFVRGKPIPLGFAAQLTGVTSCPSGFPDTLSNQVWSCSSFGASSAYDATMLLAATLNKTRGKADG